MDDYYRAQRPPSQRRIQLPKGIALVECNVCQKRTRVKGRDMRQGKIECEHCHATGAALHRVYFPSR